MIQAKVNYDKKTLTDFMRFAMINRPWKWIVLGLIFVVSLSLVILSINSDYMSYSVLSFVLVCLIEIFYLVSYFITPMIKLKNFTEDNIVFNQFSFEENNIKLFSESKARKGSSELPYSALTRIDESKTTFYLFVNKSSALIITKASITQGSTDDLRKLLISKVPNKKINKLSAK